MYLPSTIPYQQHRGFSRTFTPGHLSLGLFFPLEAFGGDIPSMLNQVALAKRAEELGFSALWFFATCLFGTLISAMSAKPSIPGYTWAIWRLIRQR